LGSDAAQPLPREVKEQKSSNTFTIVRGKE